MDYIRTIKGGWSGRYVRLKREMRTKGGAIFDAGEVMRVTRNFKGLELQAVRRCEHCQRRSQYQVARVPLWDVDVLPADYVPSKEEQ